MMGVGHQERLARFSAEIGQPAADGAGLEDDPIGADVFENPPDGVGVGGDGGDCDAAWRGSMDSAVPMRARSRHASFRAK